MTALEALARASLFEGFSETGLKIFASIAVERTLAAGAPLFAEGDEGDALYVVKSGALRLVQRVAAVDREVGLLGAGDHVGEVALLAPTVRLVSAVAAVPTELVELGRRAFFKTAQEKPQACLKLSLLIAADLAKRFGESQTLLKEALARATQGAQD
jgi:CRP/FNR family transcriptional regulator, cyclic AMP receptor protein